MISGGPSSQEGNANQTGSRKQVKTSSVNNSINQTDFDNTATDANKSLKPKTSNRAKEGEEKDKAKKDA